MLNQKIGILGIDTDIGKTIVSAIVVEALEADYWKIMQAGDLDQLDADTVKKLVSNQNSTIHETGLLLSKPMSPHAAAKIDGISVRPKDFEVPNSNNTVIIEGAGGIMVPINEDGDTIGTLMKQLADEVILISKHYLGSINHTLLSLFYLKENNIPVKGIIFVGPENKETEQIVLNTYAVKMIGRIPITPNLTPNFITEQAKILKL